MVKLTVCFLAISVLLMKVFVSGNFILTSPKVIDAGSTVYFTLTVLDVPPGGSVVIRLIPEGEDEPVAKSKVTVLSNYNMWIEMTVPPMSSDVNAELHIQGSFNNGYEIDAVRDVRIRHNTIMTFVQTDKPLYKPGQIVRFRVLPLDNQLKPLSEDTVADIWIEDPSGIRVEQWKQEKFTEGIRQFDLQLSDEPTLGTWKINTQINKVSTSHSFRVEKYVLPKFEVTIKPPSVIMADAETITIQICAKYTYGKVVIGTLSASITYEARQWDSTPIPSVEHLGQISGCQDFVVNTDDLLLQTGNFGYRTLKIFAEVTENGTGIVRNATTQVETTHYPVYIDFIRNNRYYKQKLPYYGYLRVTKPDESPSASEKIQICARFLQESSENDREICRIFTSNKNGMVPFSIAPSSAKKISLKASAINFELLSYSDRTWDVKIGVPHASMDLQPWHSPSDSYLQIETSIDEFQCDKLQQVKVRYTAKQGTTIKFYHQVLSKGRIVQQGSHQRTFYSKEQEEMEYDFHEEQYYTSGSFRNITRQQHDVGEFILSFDPRASMSPKARLLIFYVRDDKEVVADSRMFYIKKCLLNKVSLDFRHEKQYPSTEAAMLLSASPSSLCGISMVDKSVLLLEKESTFNKDKIFKLMEDFDIGKDTKPHHEPFKYDCDAPDPMPQNAQMDFRKNPYSIKRYTERLNEYVDAVMAFEEAGMVVITDLKMKTRPCQKYVHTLQPVYMMRASSGIPGIPGPPGPHAVSPEAFNLQTKAQPVQSKNQEETPKSTEEIRSYFPETWLWELHSIGSSGETAIIKRQLPHTISEWTGGAICVHPKTGLGISDIATITAFQPFFLDFQLPYSVIRGEALTLTVAVFNYLSECLPIKLSLEPSEHYKLLSEFRYSKVCVCGGQSESSRFVIRPVTLGSVNITVYGYSIEEDDEVCGNEITARLSARDAVTKPLLVEAEGFPKEEVFNYFICPGKNNGSVATEVDLLLPEDVISDSARAYMSVTGDIMGPALNGLKRLVRLPVGCGEQNMILFAPNIFVLDYLTATGKITGDIKGECVSNMKTGYQRELQYRHGDGSYSAFGAVDKEGSMWLTAFVLKCFGQARRFISIDEDVLNMSGKWILGNQFENGCFKPSGTIFHQDMKGGLSDNGGDLTPLTAFVLISLLESGTGVSQEVVETGLRCLENEDGADNYALALFAYANALAGKTQVANKYMKELDSRAIVRGNQKYWKSSSTSKSVSVEIAGYYMLASLEVSKQNVNLEKVLPVVKWITQQRNSDGGYISTQDTVVALQALAKYSSYHKEDKVDIALAVDSDDVNHGFKVDEGNKLVTQNLKIPGLPTVVELEAVGDGCALVQFSLRYNVENFLPSEAFDLNVDVRRLGSKDCNLPILSICMRYKIPNLKSNMVVITIKMVTGFSPDEWSLHLLKKLPTVQLKRFEIVGNEVNLYFNELTNEQKCFQFHVKSEFEVDDVQPSIIKLYDYYQPELMISTEYEIPFVCNVTALPSLPWLPALDSIHSEDRLAADEEFFMTTEDSSESELPCKPPSDPEHDEPLDEEYFPNSISEAADDKTDPPCSSGSKLSKVNVEAKNKFPASTAQELLGLDELSTIPLSLNDDLFEWATEALPNEPFPDVPGVIGEIQNIQGLSNDSTPIDQFVDLPHDLDFPDGLEGNVPVSVLPPEPDCPVCGDSIPENFTETFCNSAFALKVILRDGNQGTIKILQDFSFYMDHPKHIKKFGKIEVEEGCLCPLLNNNGKLLFIVGSPLNLWNSKEKKHKIQLQSSVYVLMLPSKEIHAFTTLARSLCTEDP